MSQPLQVQQVNFVDLKKLIKQQQLAKCNSTGKKPNGFGRRLYL